MPIKRKIVSVAEVGECQVVIYNNDECQVIHITRNDRITDFEEYLDLNRSHAIFILREMIMSLSEGGKINEMRQLVNYVRKTYNFTGSDSDIWPLLVNIESDYICEDCGDTHEGVKLQLCPYEEDVHSRNKHVTICSSCYDLRSDEI